MSDLVDSEYDKFSYNLIPQRIIDHYKLDIIVDNGFVYAKIDLVKHRNKHDYVQAEHTDGLFVHKIRDVYFTLVVDNFGIKYTNKQDVDHLIFIMRSKYKFKVNFGAN